MSNELMKSGDGFDDIESHDHVIQGTLAKFVDGRWSADGVEIPSNTQLLVMASTSVIQCWQDKKPTNTIFKEPGKDLPDVDELNSKIPQKEWEIGMDGQPKPPWQRQEVLYLLNPTTAEKFTYASGTIGARSAVRNLRDRVMMMRAIRGESVIPLIELASRPMKTKFGIKQRPEFKIVDWAEFGGVGLTRYVATPIADQSAEGTAAPEKNTKLRKVKPTMTGEELDDEIPF